MEPSAPLPYRPAHLTPGILVCCFNSVKPYTLVKCAVTVTIGLLVGLLAVALGRVTEGVITAKNSLVRRIIHQPAWSPEVGIVLAGLAHIAYSVALVLIGSGMVRPSSCCGLPVMVLAPFTAPPIGQEARAHASLEEYGLPCVHACVLSNCKVTLYTVAPHGRCWAACPHPHTRAASM